MKLRPGVVVVAAMCVAVPTSASAARSLTSAERTAIVKAVKVTAPKGGRITDPRCIAGRLSTVNRRWASLYLTNTPSCVKRFGGAAGESTLLTRPGVSSTTWRIAGAIGDVCSHRAGGAPDRVLVDLGCSFTP